MRGPRHILRALRRDERGSISVESVIVFPLLIWAYIATYVYFDAFRVVSLNDKSAFAIGDLLSRQTSLVTGPYLDSMLRVHELMTQDPEDVRLRLSSVLWDADAGAYEVVWSTTRGGGTALQDADLASGGALDGRMPIMSDRERVIVVEAWRPFTPPFEVGLDPIDFYSFNTISPRYASRLCYDVLGTGDLNDAAC
ncbi:TadE/TadG family type IV pilus assembly protein [Histidinibacterium aquaticum]|uniref:Pilus assembly protein n=1 Tax=Histidinibacterium aquaticum TaxID=2613962 RepID=A0A5J5GRQ2_9RHOB|nr:hypothetical protein [Histidinibacterium aquaticum]KAA9010258.1 hypothetical protein F3S47_03130 [Histidinibacterium aquaticum]